MNVRAIGGSVLVLLGAFLLLNRGEHFGTGTVFAYFWPSLFVIPLGLLFHWLYFFMLERRGVGLLVPGGILFTAGIVCQIAMLFEAWSVLWPGFILAAAIGLLELYWFGSRNKWLLIPINMLVVVAMLFFAVFSLGSLLSYLGSPVAALLLIATGTIALIGKRRTSL